MSRTTRYLTIILAFGLVAIFFVYRHTKIGIESELTAYRAECSELTDITATRFELTFNEIYVSLRTIARLPGIRSQCFGLQSSLDGNLDLSATNSATTPDRSDLIENTRLTIQEIYNSLATYICISEVYVIPSNFDPDSLDISNQTSTEPLIEFDNLITDHESATHNEPAEVGEEIHEYRVMKSQLDWFKKHYNSEADTTGLKYPLIGGKEVITCDNTHYNPTTNIDSDRAGIVFAVPYYHTDGQLGGSITCVILSKHLQNLLRSGDFAIVNTTYNFFLGSQIEGQWQISKGIGNGATQDSDLLYCEVHPIRTHDALATWSVWAGNSDDLFWSRTGSQATLKTRYLGYVGTLIFTFGTMLAVFLLLKSQQHLTTLNQSLESTVIDRTSELLDSRNAAVRAFERERTTADKLNQAMHKYEVLATTDMLTGLPNRSKFIDCIEHAMQQSQRHTNRFALLFIDFDRFKLVNDTLGHRVGDILLCRIAETFKKEMRESDTVARFGGDEFLVLLENLSNWSDATIKVERLLTLLSRPHEIETHQIISTASIGLVTNEQPYSTVDDMIRDADIAMYKAKERGKSQYVCFDETMREEIFVLRELEENLQLAIECNQLEIEYQPVLNLDSGELYGFTSSIRWQHPELGIVNPADFIPLAIDTGLIIPIGKWALRTASAQLSMWNKVSLPDHHLTLSVNVSQPELMNPTFLNDLIACKSDFNLSSGDLILEIAEENIIDHTDFILPLLTRISSEGFQIAINDDNTSVGSINALYKFPVNLIRFNQPFLSGLTSDKTELRIISTIASVAKRMHVQTVANGIVTLNHLEAMNSIGCNLGQGSYFSNPLSSSDAKTYIQRHSNYHDEAA